MAIPLFQLTDQFTMDNFNSKISQANTDISGKQPLNNNLTQYVNSVLQTIGGTVVPLGATVVVGSYVGTGTFGQNNPNTLTFNFSPKIVFISTNNSSNSGYYSSFSDGSTSSFSSSNQLFYLGNRNFPNPNEITHLTMSGQTLTWYTTSNVANDQMNASGTTYQYIAIG